MTSDQNAVTTEPADLNALKVHAKSLGIVFHPMIGLKKLQDKVANHSTAPEPNIPTQAVSSQPPAIMSIPKQKRVIPTIEMHAKIVKEATKLIRVRVACMNPNKKEWEGEIFTVSNSIVPAQKKYVPFNAEEGWFVPRIILNVIKERKCQVFHTIKGPKGEKIRKGKLIPEFSVEELAPLNEHEFNDLAKRQAMANNLD